jgi:hypothetical protein
VSDGDESAGLFSDLTETFGSQSDAVHTGLIRRTPTGSMPVVEAPPTSAIASATRSGSAKSARSIPKPPAALTAACATASASILSGWATAVMATILIAGYWHTDRLFCVAIGFLTAVSATATIGGQIAVLLRRRTGRILVIVGSVVALMIFASLFVAGATLSTIAYAIPVLPLAAIALASLPATGRWCTKT